MLTILGIALASLFWQPSFANSRPTNKKPINLDNTLIRSKPCKGQKPYQPPKIIEVVVEEEGERLKQLLVSRNEQSCAWQTAMQVNHGQPLRGDINRQDWHPQYVTGCIVIREPICYLVRETRKHPQVSCVEDCAIYQRAIELLYL